ncbi:hypothetical protein [Cellulomonas xylanilytica]|uniref:Uncharacterized protein n=1 Tax=Cellulomonas xylanilytica TaxID=233583 RepID=A0A510V517_9CELL|nr:hypothetical protein [Cellulomonas xylanilytica]GEK21011.1 hypothetical protein CXY01_15310 [Cellulomonas xylanilytica]
MTETWTTGRLVLMGAGVVLIGVGVVVGLTSVPQGQWPSVLLWLAGGVAVHDVVLAPAAVVLGALVLPRVPVGWRPALRAGALGAVVLAIFAAVIVVAAGVRRDPSVVPVPLTTSLVVATAVLVLAVLVGAAVGTARGPARGRDPADPELRPREDVD